MTEEEIERVAVVVASLIDAAWLRPDCPWTEAQYRQHLQRIDRWADEQKQED